MESHLKKNKAGMEEWFKHGRASMRSKGEREGKKRKKKG
jgi:hypothetical protein